MKLLMGFVFKSPFGVDSACALNKDVRLAAFHFDSAIMPPTRTISSHTLNNQTTFTVSSTNASPSLELTVKEDLKIYPIAYDSAVITYRFCSVLSFGTNHFGDEYTTVAIYISNLGTMPVGTTKAQVISYKNVSQYGTFFPVFFEPIKARLQRRKLVALCSDPSS
jgi:hypothetical protein